jgi:cyclopropane fatty-acyl-phospholipid synthase-like methyltransferase
MHIDIDVPSDWYEQFFTGPVNKFWEEAVPPESTIADLDFVERHLAIGPPARILDMPCGAGRHALGLARRGYDVTGVDLSEDAIVRAAAAAAGLAARFVRSDMRDFAAETPFDAMICLGNSTGYFGPDGMKSFFGIMASNVRPGGRLILDSHVCAETIFPLQGERELAFAGGTYCSRNSYDAMASTLKTEAVLTLDGEVHRLLYAHHVVTSGAMVRLLGEAGFRTLALHGDTEGAPFAPGAQRLLLVAERSGTDASPRPG